MPHRPRRYTRVLALLAVFVMASARAADYETITLGPAHTSTVLTIDASTNIAVFRGVLQAFSQRHPDVRIVYTELPTQVLHEGVMQREAAAPGTQGGPDVVISSSMDLQTKLANDGYALAHRSVQTQALPTWANWRDEVFSIGAEALVIAYDTRRLAPADAPRTRRDLIALLRAPERALAGRVGTYDVQQSGIGYLAAAQDARLDSMAGALLSALGTNGVVVAESADTTLDRLVSGRIALAYNVLESYAQRRIDDGAPLAIVRPEDYTLVLSRAALIPRQAPRPDLAARFLDFLLSEEGQQIIVSASGMLPVRGPAAAAAGPSARPVGLGVGLLVYQDALKRGYFLRSWRAALCLDCVGPAPR